MDLWKDNIAVIREQNPWWVSGTVPSDLVGTVRRVYYEHILGHLASQREMLLLEGPRRVGKTTLIYQVISRLLSSVKPDHILYVSVDDPYLNRETLFKDIQNYFEEFVARDDLRSTHEAFYVLLDEVTALEGSELFVKCYYDLRFPFRFVCTSSAAAFLLAIEVKFRTDPLDRDGLRGLEHFTRRFSPHARIIVSRDTHKLHDERTLVVPLRLFLG